MPPSPSQQALRSATPLDPEDRATLVAAQQGDRGAFSKIVLRYQDRIYNTMLRMTGDADDARELAQETFVKALASLAGFRGDAQASTWLMRIAMNLALTQLRKTKRRRTFSLEGASNGSGRPDDQAAALLERVAQQRVDPPAEALLRRERREQVLAALGRIDPEARALLVMRDIDGQEYQQMADVLDLPLGTLKSKLFRARLALREELKPFFGPDKGADKNTDKTPNA